LRPISESEFQENIKNIYNSIFASEDPYREPFQINISSKLLLYRFRYGLLTREPWLDSVTRAIKTIDEDGFYVTLLQPKGDQPWHWYVPVEDASLYLEEVYPVENAIYSCKGSWGIICSESDHAVAGGSKEFIESIYNSIPDWDQRIKDFIGIWKHYHNQNKKIQIDWIPILLNHVYGQEIAKKLLIDNNFEPQIPNAGAL
jgi:hypothetical protein